MPIQPVLDHEDEGVALLISQFRKPNVEILLRALLSQVQGLENAAVTLLDRAIDNLSGYRLDVAGRIVGRERLGMTDDVYRVWIKGKIAANRSSGLTEQILALVVLVFGDVDTTLIEDFPAGFTLYIEDAIDGAQGAEFARLLQIAKAAGVAAQLWWVGESAAFQFSDDGTTVASSPNGFGAGAFAAASDGSRSAVYLPGTDPLVLFAADLVLGYDAANASGDPADSLPDASSLGNDLSGSGSTRPDVALADVGYPVLVYDGSDDVLSRTSSVSTLQVGDGFYCWAFVKFANETPADIEQIISAKLSATKTAFALSRQANDKLQFSLRYDDSTNNTVSSTATIEADKSYLIEGWLDPDDQLLKLAINGAAPDTAAATSPTVAAGALPTELYLGDHFDGGRTLDGELRQVGVINRMPTDEERATVLRFFHAWGG